MGVSTIIDSIVNKQVWANSNIFGNISYVEFKLVELRPISDIANIPINEIPRHATMNKMLNIMSAVCSAEYLNEVHSAHRCHEIVKHSKIKCTYYWQV
jgi:hypothetical protein